MDAGDIESLALQDAKVVGGRCGVIVVGPDDGNALRSLRNPLRRHAAIWRHALDDRSGRDAPDGKCPRVFQQVATGERQRGIIVFS